LLACEYNTVVQVALDVGFISELRGISNKPLSTKTTQLYITLKGLSEVIIYDVGLSYLWLQDGNIMACWVIKQQQQQQQHSLFSQASWGRLEMKPERNKFKAQAH